MLKFGLFISKSEDFHQISNFVGFPVPNPAISAYLHAFALPSSNKRLNGLLL